MTISKENRKTREDISFFIEWLVENEIIEYEQKHVLFDRYFDNLNQ